MNIMFVCTGNICRSAMAHWLMKKKIEDLNIEDIKVYSCGIYAETGDIPTFEAIETMEDYDVDLKQHRATNIIDSNIKQMDLILCATNIHKIQVISICPEVKDKTYTMKEYVGYDEEGHDKINIKDPWGYGIGTYRACVNEIEKCLDLLIEKLEKGKNI